VKAAELLLQAHDLVANDRAATHGDKLTNHLALAAIWNGYLLARTVSGRPDQLSAEDVANMMELLKIGRRLNGDFNPDDYIDGAGYAGVAGEIAASYVRPRAIAAQPHTGMAKKRAAT
jgi:hypothetical protein